MEIDFSDREKAARDADFFNALLDGSRLGVLGDVLKNLSVLGLLAASSSFFIRALRAPFNGRCRASGVKVSPFSVGRPRRGVLLG